MKVHLAVVTLAMLTVAGCDKPKPQATGVPGKPNGTVAALPRSLFLAAEPADAKAPEELKKTVKAGDTVAVRGRIGGSVAPFVAGRAVFTVMGPGIKACSDNPDDHCKVPWDYCCESAEDIATHAATVQVVDAAGAPLKVDVKGQNGIKELSDVIVVGKVAQAEGKVLVVNATGMYVAKK